MRRVWRGVAECGAVWRSVRNEAECGGVRRSVAGSG